MKKSSMVKVNKYRILGECLLISSLPGKPRDSTCILKAEPGKLDVKRCEPGILYISLYQFIHWFTFQTSNYDIIIAFCVATSFKKCIVMMT